MKKDIKYIIKRILIGVGISLLLGFIHQNVYAFEWTTEGDEYIYNSNQVRLQVSDIDFYTNSSISYPFTDTSYLRSYNMSCNSTTIDETSYCLGTQGSYGNLSNSSIYGPYLYLGYQYRFTNLNLDKGHYYIVLPFGYDWVYNNNPNNFTYHLSYNNDKFLDSSSYTIDNDNINLISASANFNVDNPFPDNNLYGKIFYIKVYFEVLNPVTSFNLTIGDLSSQSAILTSYNNTSYNNYLIKYGFTDEDKSNAKYYYVYYQPMIYSHIPGSIYPDVEIPDFSSSLEDTIKDINDDISNNINENGVYTGDGVLDSFGGGGGAGIAFGSNNLSDILIVPLRFLQKFNSDTTCTPIEIPLPKLNSNVALPCMSNFYTTFLGEDIFSIVQTIIGVGLGFKIAMSFYYTILNLLDPTKMITN